MPQTNYAFVIKAPGYQMATHQATLESPEFHTRVVGVTALADALTAVDRLVEDGVEIIELCGGFSSAEATEIRERAGPAVSVGLVVYDE
ncbi:MULTISPECIES: DUF6506 family protein [Rhodopseudomonas]|uniref:Uncharacterized protein n=1 Tax=Rhodopseudomonas palustris TaxID=1076 RepID=A0A0D7F7D1_RHOPL|nr:MULTISPECIES: DUF6506 family protein [Rhodopseudomonas]KIZ47627.1 hypothetical protein OO17_03260 [Rhodopseudomonas palustris]MDF3811205.1 DUF6506 family protein [Rhodopseudomonas sp. BAL398]WOK19547.1 DUF6506 family protein [Rhodopseudomonas sp. BAL398]